MKSENEMNEIINYLISSKSKLDVNEAIYLY